MSINEYKMRRRIILEVLDDIEMQQSLMKDLDDIFLRGINEELN